MAQIVPVVRLAAHAKSSTLYGRSCGRTVVSPNFFGLMGYDRLLLFHVIMGYAARASRAASSAINRIIHKLLYLYFESDYFDIIFSSYYFFLACLTIS